MTLLNQTRGTAGSLQHEHWAQFPPLPYHFHLVMGLCLGFTAVTGTVGNAVFLGVLLRSPKRRRSHNIFLINLSLSDLLVCCVTFPLSSISSFCGHWIFSETVCAMYTVLTGVFGLTTISTMAMMAADRYLVIVRGKRVCLRTGLLVNVGCWLYAAFWMSPPLFGWSRVVLDGSNTSCTFDFLTRERNEISYVICIVLAGFCTPLILTVVSYAGIYIHVFKQEREMRRIQLRTTPQSRRGNDIKVAKLGAVMVGLFIICWFPYAVVSIIGVLGDQALLTPVVSAMPALFAKMSRFTNPFIYITIFSPKFTNMRKALIPTVNFGMRMRTATRAEADQFQEVTRQQPNGHGRFQRTGFFPVEPQTIELETFSTNGMQSQV